MFYLAQSIKIVGKTDFKMDLRWTRPLRGTVRTTGTLASDTYNTYMTAWDGNAGKMSFGVEWIGTRLRQVG